jgi:hypothetical protein
MMMSYIKDKNGQLKEEFIKENIEVEYFVGVYMFSVLQKGLAAKQN